MIEDDEDVPPIRYVKARPGRLFKHKLEALRQKTEITNLDWYAMKRFYRLQECYFGLELNEKPPVDAVHMKLGDVIRP